MKKSLLVMVLCVPVFSGIFAQELLPHPAALLEDEKKLQVVVFLSPECPLCRNYTLTLNQLYKQYGDHVRFTGIVPGKAYTAADVKEFTDKYKITWPVYIDTGKTISTALQAKVTPEAYLLRGQKKVYYHGSIDNWIKELGGASARPTIFYLRDAINETLADKPVQIAYNKPVGCLINDY
ncbi:MAG: redoxin domain-containing protein [Sphingobacteriales bacterium]|nr:redoxin domain-containing protein [Sphingobacteriales bacterium]